MKLNFYLLIFLFFCPNLINSQNLNWLSARSYGDFDDDRSTCVISDAANNVFVTGYFGSPTLVLDTVTLTNNDPGTYDIFIAKFNSAGDIIWAKSWGGIGFDYSNSITLDSAGNIIMTGNFRSPTITFGTTTLTNAGTSYDFMIAKFDPQGNPLWAKRAGGISDETSNSVVAVSANSVVVTGYFTSATITFGSTTLTNAQNLNADMFIVKYDTAGTVQWAKRAGGTNGDYGFSVSTDGNNNVYLTGHFGSNTILFGTTTLTNANTNATMDIFLVKYDGSGNVVWAKRAGGSGDDKSNCVKWSLYGYIYICGYFMSPTIAFGTTTLTNAGIYDMYIARFDGLGNANWAVGAGGPGFDECKGLTVLSNGSVFATGYFDSPSITIGATQMTNVSGNDVFVCGYTWNGGFILAESAGGMNSEEGVSICPDNNGNAILTGPFSSAAVLFGIDSVGSVGSNDFFITTISGSNLMTGIESTPATEWSVYPNPSDGNINFITVSACTNASVEIIDVQGRVVYAELLGNRLQGEQVSIQPQLVSGVYFIRIEAAESPGHVERIIIE